MTDLEQAGGKRPICEDPTVVDRSTVPLVLVQFLNAAFFALVCEARLNRRIVSVRTALK
ncbi:hypothetical protein [Natrinema soli]|uniref:Uncharacterized protein n=1 Tax=Natrinema soli TaxID=1930624 RepID=A0ABD5SNI2_9EURY|nr:hypothetical protein [Natrinema soli]